MSAAIPGVQSGGTTPSTSSAGPSKGLGEGDFMNLLLAQMKNQDPMDPLKDTDFIAQLAQFSQLNGINQLNTSISSLLLMQGLTQGSNLIGKSVAYTTEDKEATTKKGTVESVTVNKGQIQLLIGGAAVNLSQVLNVQNAT